MEDADFPEDLCHLIRDVVPTVEAAELLLAMARLSEKSWAPADLAKKIKPSVISIEATKKALHGFVARGLAFEKSPGCFQFSASAALAESVAALQRAYNERPVTLIRMIYEQKDLKIQSFANAFKLKKD